MKTKIDIFSGFLGAGKTTLIRKLIKEAYQNEKIVLIENEFGEISIDSDFLADAGVKIKEMSQGCICCSLVGDFTQSLKIVLDQYQPERIIIEPSGVGKLSDVIKAVSKVVNDDVMLNSYTTVVDANKMLMYSKNFGEFYNDQIESANCVIISRSSQVSAQKLAEICQLIKERNENATIITTEWDKLDGKTIVDTMEHLESVQSDLAYLTEQLKQDKAHQHDQHEDECCCHHHEHEEGECCCHHHEHEEGEHCHLHEHEEGEHCHHHEHEDGEHCCHHHEHEEGEHCHHDHDDHQHHHADEIFSSWGNQTSRKFSWQQVEDILNQLSDADKYGTVLRAKGIVESEDGKWIYFDYVPSEINIREGNPIAMSRYCVIGSKINQSALQQLFED
ncbi:MAG: GTP-binding protein [Erysipelotrichaceae bacterium]